MTGLGVLKGMGVTFKTLLETYAWGGTLLRMLRIPPANGLVTIEYPETKQQHAERFRYFPFLVYDKDPDDMRCVACKICEQECPPACIEIVMEKDEQGRPVKKHNRTRPVVFNIDVSVCMSCRICVDVCPFDAIEMDNDYELATPARYEPLILNQDELLKSAEYFKQIKPTEAAVVNQRLEIKQKAAAAKAARAALPPQPPKPPAEGSPGAAA